MTNKIHPSAIVNSKNIGKDVKIGPYCIVDAHAILHDNVELVSHVVVTGYTTIGEGTKIWPFATIGAQPQDLKFQGEKSEVIIGKRNKIREYVTIHPGTSTGGLITRIGDDCLLMIGTHIAHDCIVGNNVIMANYATLAGHVVVEDFVIIGGLSAVSQFVTLGAFSFVGGHTGVTKNLIPFGITGTEHGYLNGLNLIGLKRKNFTNQEIKHLQDIYKTIFSSQDGDFESRLNAICLEYVDNPSVMQVVDFIKNVKLNSILMPRNS